MTVKPKPKGLRPKVAVTPARLAAVPASSYFDTYISRDIVPNVSEFDVFDKARARNMNVLIEGPTGPGKTSAVMAYAAREEVPFYAVSSNIAIEPSQLFGKLIPTASGGFEWVDGPVTDLVRHGGVLLLNEVNFIPERVATVLFGLLDKRRSVTLLDHKGEMIEAHDDLLIVADMNPDYAGTRPLNAAFRNRFAVQLWWDYNSDVESKLVRSSSLLDMASKFRQAMQNDEYETPVSTNMLQEFESINDILGFDFARTNFVNHFAKDERQAAVQVLDTYRVGILEELRTTPKTKVVSDATEGALNEGFVLADPQIDVDDEWELEPEAGQKVFVDADGERFMVDPVNGIYGTDWSYEGE